MFRSASLSRGFRRLFHPAALGRWWHANPSAVTEAVTTLAKHAQQSGELWQLTFDVMLLCFTCIHDTDFQALCRASVDLAGDGVQCSLRCPPGVTTHILRRPSRIVNYALEDAAMHVVQVWEGLTGLLERCRLLLRVSLHGLLSALPTLVRHA